MRRADPDVFLLDREGLLGLRDLGLSNRSVIETLGPLMTDERVQRIETVLAARTRRLVVVLDGLHDPHNCGAVLRSCDAFGVQEVVAVERDEPFVAARRATSGAHKWVEVNRFRDSRACLAELKRRGFVVAVAVPEGRLSLSDLRCRQGDAGGRLALVFGNEHSGVSPEFGDGADETFRVPMVGFTESLNVSVAVAVSLHALREGSGGDLGEADLERLRASFYRQSVREADMILAEGLRS